MQSELNWVAPSIADPPPAISFHMHRRLVCQYSGGTAKLPGLAKRLTFEPMMQFQIIQDLECLKTVRHSLFYDWLTFLLVIRRGGPVNTSEEEEDSLSD